MADSHQRVAQASVFMEGNIQPSAAHLNSQAPLTMQTTILKIKGDLKQKKDYK